MCHMLDTIGDSSLNWTFRHSVARHFVGLNLDFDALASLFTHIIVNYGSVPEFMKEYSAGKATIEFLTDKVDFREILSNSNCYLFDCGGEDDPHRGNHDHHFRGSEWRSAAEQVFAYWFSNPELEESPIFRTLAKLVYAANHFDDPRGRKIKNNQIEFKLTHVQRLVEMLNDEHGEEMGTFVYSGRSLHGFGIFPGLIRGYMTTFETDMNNPLKTVFHFLVDLQSMYNQILMQESRTNEVADFVRENGYIISTEIGKVMVIDNVPFETKDLRFALRIMLKDELGIDLLISNNQPPHETLQKFGITKISEFGPFEDLNLFELSKKVNEYFKKITGNLPPKKSFTHHAGFVTYFYSDKTFLDFGDFSVFVIKQLNVFIEKKAEVARFQQEMDDLCSTNLFVSLQPGAKSPWLFFLCYGTLGWCLLRNSPTNYESIRIYKYTYSTTLLCEILKSELLYEILKKF